MSETLEPFGVASVARCEAAFHALAELHAAGFAHDDSRLPSLLSRTPTEAAWIDLRASSGGSAGFDAARVADAIALAASVLPVPIADVSAAVEGLDPRVPGGGRAASSALSAAVWAADKQINAMRPKKSRNE